MSYSYRVVSGAEHFELPDFQASSLGFDFSEVGVFTGDYAKYGKNADRLVDKAVIIALWNGEEGFDCRYQIRAGEGDDSTESFIKKVTGFSLLNIFERVVVEEIPAAPGVDVTFNAATGGGILTNLLTAAQARGAATGITWDFTDLVDSNGDPWDKVVSLTYRLGLKYIDLIRNLVDQGMVEVRFDGTVFQAFNSDAMGVDLSDAITLNAGIDYLETPRKWSSETQANRSMTMGDEGVIVRTEDPAIPVGPFGYEEMAVSQGGTKDVGTLTLVNTAALERVRETRQQLTRKVLIREDGPIPNLDYRVSDYISEMIPTFDGTEEEMTAARYRVRSLIIQLDDSGTIGSADMVLNDKFLEAQIRTARKVNGILGGGSADGGGNGIPSGEEAALDLTTPTAPTGLVLDTDVFIDVNGVTKAILVADWNAPALNTDGSAVTDLNLYELQWYYNDESSATRRTILTSDSVATVSGLDPNRTVLVRVRAWDNASPVAHKSDWSAEVPILLEKDTTPPPVPTAPTLFSKLGTITYSWDGLGVGAVAMPKDFFRVKVYMGDTAGFPADVAHQIGSLPASGSGIVTGLPADAVRYFKFTSLDRNGNESATSAETNVTVLRIAGPDLEANSITANELDVGSVDAAAIQGDAIDGMIITGAWIRTAADGARWEILGADSTGYANIIEGFTGRPEELTPAEFRVDSTVGGISLQTADFGLGEPARIDLSNDIPPGKTTMETSVYATGQSMFLDARRQMNLQAGDYGQTRINLYSDLEFDLGAMTPKDRLGIEMITGDEYGDPFSMKFRSGGGWIDLSAISSVDQGGNGGYQSRLYLEGGLVDLQSGWSNEVKLNKDGIKFTVPTGLSTPAGTWLYNLAPGGFSADTTPADGIGDGWVAYTAGSAGTITRTIVSGAQRIQASALGASTGDRAGIRFSCTAAMMDTLGIRGSGDKISYRFDAKVGAAIGIGKEVRVYIDWYSAANTVLYSSQAIIGGENFTTAMQTFSGTMPINTLPPDWANVSYCYVYIWIGGRSNGQPVSAVDLTVDNLIVSPYDSTYGEPVGYFFDGATRPVQVAPDAQLTWAGAVNASASRMEIKPETRRNRVVNPSFEVNATDWGANGAGTTVVREDFYPMGDNGTGECAGKVTLGAGAQNGIYSGFISVDPGKSIGARAFVAPQGIPMSIQIMVGWCVSTSSSPFQYSNLETVTVDADTPTVIGGTALAPPTAAFARLFIVRNPAGAAGQIYRVDEALLRVLASGETFDKYEYFDGTYVNYAVPPTAGTRWTGTTQGSQSVLVDPDIRGDQWLDFDNSPSRNLQIGSPEQDVGYPLVLKRLRINPSGQILGWKVNQYLGALGYDTEPGGPINGMYSSGLVQALYYDDGNAVTGVGSMQQEPYGKIRAIGSKARFYTDPAWTAPTLGNSWSNYVTGNHRLAGFIKDASGFVCLRGLIKGGTLGISAPAFVLPPGYRPDQIEIFSQMASGGVARVDVYENGNVCVMSLISPGTNAYVSLAGMRFDPTGGS